MAGSKLTWLVTGASSGIGYEIAASALAKGHQVIATSRSLGRLEPLKAKGAALIELDQNQSFEHVQSAIKAALEVYQGVDIIVNNAAYVQRGTLEEATAEETLQQFQANVFGPLNIYRAILPHFREKRSGLLATIGSMAAWYTLPGCNLYNASKAALRGIMMGLQGELASFGIKHCLIEPGVFRTELLNPTTNMAKSGEKGRLPDYAEMNTTTDKIFDAFHGTQIGDPVKAGKIIVDVLTSSGVAIGREVPPFFPLGSDAVSKITKSAEETIKQAKEWADVASMSDLPSEK